VAGQLPFPSVRHVTLLAFVLAAIGSTACGSNLSTARKAVATFHERLDAGQLAETRQSFGPKGPMLGDWERYIAARMQLGKLVRQSEAAVDEQPPFGAVFITLNTELTHGRAVEQFSFKITNGNAELMVYTYHAGKRFDCPVIGRCAMVDAPAVP
jgi:hypothetical protein